MPVGVKSVSASGRFSLGDVICSGERDEDVDVVRKEAPESPSFYPRMTEWDAVRLDNKRRVYLKGQVHRAFLIGGQR